MCCFICLFAKILLKPFALRVMMCEPQEPPFCFLEHSLGNYSNCHLYNLTSNILLITMSLYNRTRNISFLMAVRKGNTIESLEALPVCTSMVLTTRSDAICRYAHGATLVMGHLLPGVLSKCFLHSWAAADMAVHTWLSLKQDPRHESTLTALSYHTETSLQGAVVLKTNNCCSAVGPSLVKVQQAAACLCARHARSCWSKL